MVDTIEILNTLRSINSTKDPEENKQGLGDDRNITPSPTSLEVLSGWYNTFMEKVGIAREEVEKEAEPIELYGLAREQEAMGMDPFNQKGFSQGFNYNLPSVGALPKAFKEPAPITAEMGTPLEESIKKASTLSDRKTEHIVGAKDNLTKIAADNNTTVASLLKLNPNIKNKNSIKEGSSIILPSSQTYAPLTSLRPKLNPNTVIPAIEKAETKQQVVEAIAKPVIEFDKNAADNPLEFIFSRGLIGLDENNAEHQATIRGYLNNAVKGAYKDADVTSRNSAWCGAFVDHVLTNLGGQEARLDYESKSVMAVHKRTSSDEYDRVRGKAYMGYGKGVSLEEARPGDIFVKRSPDKYEKNKKTGEDELVKGSWHVAFYVGRDAEGNILALGGNQDNRVKVSAYPKSQLEAIRRGTSVVEMDKDVLEAISKDIVVNKNEPTG